MPRKKTTTPVAQQIIGKPAVIKNRFVLCIDTSSSMCGIHEDARVAVNSMLDTIRTQTEQQGQYSEVAIVEFNSTAKVLLKMTDINRVQNLNTYVTMGSTALNDGIVLGVETADNGDAETGFLVLTFTDGEENVSKVSTHDLKNYIKQYQNRGNWTFAFQVPMGKRNWVADRYGVPLDNVREWEQTQVGTQVMASSNTVGLSNYMTMRSSGVTASPSFYCQPDLSGLKPTQLKKKLTDLSAKFKSYTVDKETPIKEFVEAKTKKNYVIGSSFYALTKKEKVQPNKSVLIVQKGKTEIWGGDEARELIGLPTNGSSATVEPGNHAMYDIYINSTSVNRKLVRGTKVLVDTTKTKDAKPTWDHTAVAN